MAELEIPIKAYDCLDYMLRGFRKAVRIAIAAELRRIVKLEGDDIKSWRLLKRADELDPPEMSK